MEQKLRLLVSELGDHRVKTDIDISEHIKSNLGGLVQAFYIATTTRELLKAIDLCRELKIDYFIIGSGTKVAISDKGIKGLVIKNRSDNIKISGVRGKISSYGLGIEEAILTLDSGVSIQRLSDFTQSQDLLGLEILKGLPGTIGGNLYINPALKEKVQQVKVYTKNGAQKIKKASEVMHDDIILSVVMKLRSKGSTNI